MSEEWFVRVQGKEYGPVDLDELQEWKAEGRLIPLNEVRPSNAVDWVIAGSLPELFPPGEAEAGATAGLVRRRTFGDIISETFRIYRKGFPQFFALALLVAIPSLALKLSLAFVDTHADGPATMTTRVASGSAVLAILCVMASWPLFLGALQFATRDLALGRPVKLPDLLRRSASLWSRLAKLSVFVYGSFTFWTVLPLLAVLAVAANPTLPSLLLALLALLLQVYMAGRLFINFLFWQQSCTLGELEGVQALRDSRELARSRAEAPRMERPLYRGAALASIWLVVLVAVSIAVEMPFLFARLSGITNIEDAVAMMQALVNAPRPDAMTIATYVLSSLMHALLRPLLGIAFVVLYFDAKAGR